MANGDHVRVCAVESYREGRPVLYKVTVGLVGRPRTWTVERRYSAFASLRATLRTGARGVPFPSKVVLGTPNLARRRAELDDFVREIIARPMPPEEVQALHNFLGVSERPLSAVNPGSSSHTVASGAMDDDPLLGLGMELGSVPRSETEAARVGLGVGNHAGGGANASPQPPGRNPLPAATSGATAAVAAAPSPFSTWGVSGGRPREYASTVGGLRDAIKDSSAEGVASVLSSAPELACAVDSAGQSMLHVAAIFGASTGSTAVVDLLLQHGADAQAQNSDGQTCVDLADEGAPALAAKLRAHLNCARPETGSREAEASAKI